MRIFQNWRDCPRWAVPFFDANGAGGTGEAAAEEATAAAATEEGTQGATGGDEPSKPGKDSLLSKAGVEADGASDPEKPGESGKEADREGGEAKEGEGDDGPVTKEALTIPEGQEWDDEMGASLLEVINDAALSSKDKTQKIIDMIPAYQEKLLASVSAASAAENQKLDDDLKATEAAWAKTSATDAEFGGDMWKANLGVIAKGRDQLATAEAVEIIEAFGLGNHPELLRMFYRAGKLLSEDPTRGSGTAASGPKGRADAMFGKSLEGLNIKGADD